MKNGLIKNRQGGFMMKIVLAVVGISIAFIVFSSLAQNITSKVSENGSYQTSTSNSDSNWNANNNELLSFLNTGSRNYSSSYGTLPSNVSQSERSPYAGQIYLSAGSASGAYQPFEEYVTLRNNGQSSVSITGWTLTNSKGTRPIETSQNDYIYPVADSATIGEGTEFLDPSGSFVTGAIVLRPGDDAILTTSRPFVQFPFSINTSFRENICQGYLRNYPFEPPLSRYCPDPLKDPQIRTVTDECYDYMQTLGRCVDPQKYDKEDFDSQTAQCRSFMTSRLNYNSCVARSRYESNFSLGEWRIFLGKGAELWADRRETITLYDSQGLIVSRISY